MIPEGTFSALIHVIEFCYHDMNNAIDVFVFSTIICYSCSYV